MVIKKAELEAVAVKKNQYPEDNTAEIAFAGRSNVGKSSLLNLLTNRRSLARVSGNPGKTRTINFYRINDAFRIVDLPGYGYAKLSKSVTENWGAMMEAYFQNRQGLKKSGAAGGYPPCAVCAGSADVRLSAPLRTGRDRGGNQGG